MGTGIARSFNVKISTMHSVGGVLMIRTLSFFLILRLLATEAGAQTTGSLCGSVHSVDGQPIRGAVVRIFGTSPARGAITKENGKYLTAGLRAGIYDIQVSAVGFISFTIQTVNVNVGMNTTLDVRLESRPASMDSIVVTTRRDSILPEKSGENPGVTSEEMNHGARTNIQGEVSLGTIKTPGVNGFSIRGGEAEKAAEIQAAQAGVAAAGKQTETENERIWNERLNNPGTRTITSSAGRAQITHGLPCR